MATKKVSALTALTSPDGSEELLINDGGTSKKVTITNANKKLFSFLDANGNYIQMQKGEDIASASPTVIDTDGDYFICTGTTGFTTFTVAADRHFFLEFAAALTMTHGAGTLDLPGGANITTAASDVGEFYSTAANVVTCVNYTKADGTPIAVNIVDDTTPQLGGDLDVNGNDIVSTTNADIDIIPHGTGDVNLGADTVQVGDNNADATITTQGTGDLILNTNNGTNAGNITLADGANGNISITPNGTGNVALGGELDCNGNQIQWSQGADVASATALAVLTDGNYFDVTGTTTITSINTTGGVGTLIKLHFDGALTLTHDATDLILPGGANITTAAGDEAEFIEYASGDYRCTNYSKASGNSPVDSLPLAGGTLTGALTVNAATVFNESGADVDFRVEGSGEANALFVQGSDGNVGIGTDSPSANLHVVSTTGGVLRLDRNDVSVTTDDSLGAIEFSQNDASDQGAGVVSKIESINESNFSGSAGIAFSTGNATSLTERMRIDSAGKVGIGTASPASLLSVQGDGLQIRLDGTANTSRGILLRSTGTAEGQIHTDGNMHFIQEDASKYMRFSTANTERMRIDNSGNVGIGTDDPSTYGNLVLYGGGSNKTLAIIEGSNSPADNDTYGSLSFGGRTDGTITAKISGLAGDNTNGTDGQLALYTADNTAGSGTLTERMRINSTGYVGINNVAASPSHPLHITKEIGGYQAYFDNDNGSAQGIKVRINANDAGNFNMLELVSASTGSDVTAMVVRDDGYVGIGTTAPGQLLDLNSGSGYMIADGYNTHSLAIYKENIEDASGYLDKVLACPAQKWNRKPFVSADEIKEAVLEEFGEDVLIEEAVEAQDAVYEDVEVTPAIEAADAVMGERAVTETVETGSYVNLAGETITETEEQNITEEVTETVVERQTGEDGITREVEVERTVQRNVMEAYEIQPAIEVVDAVIEQQLVSEAVEAKDAVYEKQYSVWDELFPEDNSHRQKALYNMPDGDLKTWIDDWCEAKRVEMRLEDKWQKKRLGLVADAELTAEHLPEVVSINDEGEPTGIDTMTYIGILHNAIQELSAKVETLENA